MIKKREDYLRKLFYLLRLRPDVHDMPRCRKLGTVVLTSAIILKNISK
jgi:hypothetical protein